MDVAASIQKVTEDVMISMATRLEKNLILKIYV